MLGKSLTTLVCFTLNLLLLLGLSKFKLAVIEDEIVLVVIIDVLAIKQKVIQVTQFFNYMLIFRATTAGENKYYKYTHF